MRGTLTEEEKAAQPWRCVRRFRSRPPAPGTRCPRTDEPTACTPLLTIAPSPPTTLTAAGSEMLVTAPLDGCQKLDIARGDAGKVYRTYAQ